MWISGLWRAWVKSMLVVIILSSMVGCEKDDRRLGGFTLPAGDIERGKMAFVELGCRQCHTVAEVDLPEYHGPMRFQVELGGEVLKVKTYAELLTSVVNPSHVLAEQFIKSYPKSGSAPSESPMPDFNGTMTVAQLIDITEFLHSRYTLLVPEYQGVYYGP